MPRTRSLAWSELKIGLLSLFAIAMATFLIFLLSGEGGFFWQRYQIRTVFDDIAGLKPGAPVRLAGVEIGAVSETRFVDDRVEVDMAINTEHRSRITTESVASLGTVSLLGEAAVDITAASGGTPIPDNGYVPSGPGEATLSDVATQAAGSVAQVTALLEDVRAGRGTLGRLFTDDSLYLELNRLVSAAENVARSVNEGRGTLGRLVTDSAAAEALEASMRNLETVTARIRAGEGTIGHLLADDTLSRSLTGTTTNLDAITDGIRRGEGTAGALVTDRALYDRLNAMAARLDQVTTALAQGEGTAGQLLQDRQLYENMNGAVTELQALLADIRADPRKFLTVRVSIF